MGLRGSNLDALMALDKFVATYGAKYPKAVEKLLKDKLSLLAFYDFPAEHWQHIRTTNPIESMFATLRHRTPCSRNSLSQTTFLGLGFGMHVFRLRESTALARAVSLSS